MIFVCANAEHIQRALPVITELGHFALIMAFVMSVAVSVLPFIGLRSGTSPFAALAAPATLAMMMAVCAAFAALLHAFITSDFSVALVASHSHSTKPLIYKISGTWGNHEGSLLLWILILALFGGALAAGGRGIDAGLKVAYEGTGCGNPVPIPRLTPS